MIRTGTKWCFIFAVLVVFSPLYILGGCSMFDDDGGSDADGDGDGDGDADGTNDDSNDDSDTGPELIGQDPCAECAGFTGADVLVVVDNSISMQEEQQILATGFFTLINALVNPPEENPQVAGDIRLAVTSSDMGLQYGLDGEEAPDESAKIPQCDKRYKGDDGVFISDVATEIEVQSNRIKCLEDGTQCPMADWTCVEGLCVAPDEADSAIVDCPDLDDDWTESSLDDPNTIIANQIACMAQLGTAGCGVEQQLKAGVRALTRDDQQFFIRDDKLLTVIVVSDEEDCSIADPGLFETLQWTSGELFNTACNLPESNEEDFLFSIDYFYESLLALKNNQRNAVVFAGIIGVPPGKEPCEGTGDQLDDCLDHPDMVMRVEQFTKDGTEFTHFRPACTREVDGEEVTSARPGRRYVKLAQKFSCNGYIYSICNADWSKAMSEIARLINECTVIVVK